MKQITLIIDGKSISAAEGETLLTVALANGIYLPNLCYIKGRVPQAASCRLCWVGVAGKNAPVTACTEKVIDGMAVNTQDENARRLATTSFELIMASHPLDCANCERNGTCQLQKIAVHLKADLNTKRFRRVFRGAEIDDSHPRITYDANKCILCGRCVYICRERLGEAALGFAHRGFKRRVSTFTAEPLGTYACGKCDACARVCPVGALMLKK